MHPKPLVDAAFALKDPGDVSAPVRSDKGWHVLKLVERRKGSAQPIADVTEEIRKRLFPELRTAAKDKMIAELKKRSDIQVFEERLGRVYLDIGLRTGPAPGDIGVGMSGASSEPAAASQ